MNRAPSLAATSGIGSTYGTSTPSDLRSRRSITSDFDTSSILDSVSLNNMSMNNDSHNSPPRELYVGEKNDHQFVIPTIATTAPTTSQEKPYKKNEKTLHSPTKQSPPDPISSISVPGNKTTVTTAQSPTSPTSPTDRSRSFSVTGDDIEAAFDAIASYKSEHSPTSNPDTFYTTHNHNNNNYEVTTPDALFGLSSIPEDHDELRSSIYDTKKTSYKPSTDTNPDNEIEEIDFDSYFKPKQQPTSTTTTTTQKVQNETPSKKQEKKENSKRKETAPHKEEPSVVMSSLPPKSVRSVPEEKPVVKEMQKPSANIYKEENVKRPAPVQEVKQQPVPIKIEQPSPRLLRNNNDSIEVDDDDDNDEDDDDDDDRPVDDDVNEIVAKLETSAILPLINDIRPSHLIYSNRYNHNNKNNNNVNNQFDDDIPTPNADVIIMDGLTKYNTDQSSTSSSAFNSNTHKSDRTALPDIVGEPNQHSKTSNQTQPVKKGGLNVLGYDNVNSSVIQPKIRKELEYLDREELLHVISYQSELLKKKDTRLKDLEGYVDSLLVKILEQCPAILQVGKSYR
ncbi:unnamed protein product [Didymodactylos carnosus]|uniref:FIP-RBD domain-containing protein n=1 Tax=Didymodactylos carnosus TaxID=1234261 RepID=A0A813WWB9_9BILA|nr:unnamed protein product [Didymodactylos carnosus]CAF1007130.1 unnamed protein product [Didymodactylos carnosus]CAF3648457.1 unnamed protein product [Didymodactylos carnosus]CAF3776164.1 unnamed protein product [Didymodactylos carnosus]